jgi:hypothetical protein
MIDARLKVGQSVGEALRERRASLELTAMQRRGVIGNPHAFGRKGSTQTWGRPMLRIPPADWVQLIKRNPLLAAKDPKVFSAAWLEFERSDESIPYRMIEDAIHGPRNPVYIGAG